MMNVAVIISLVALLVPGGHCQPKMTSPARHEALGAVPFLTTNSINKRQIGSTACDLQNFLASGIPEDCASVFSMGLSSFENVGMNSATITTGYRLICQPRCGDPLIGYYKRCGLSQFIDIVRGLCTRDNANRLCYEEFGRIIFERSQVQSNCSLVQSATCTTACRNALNTFGNSGCCINILNTTLFGSTTPTTFRNNLWSDCSVDTPGFCNLERSSLSSAAAPKVFKAFLLLTLVVMAILLL